MIKIILIPFAYTMDKWRYGVYRGEIKPNDYNCEFWKLRETFSGIQPPVRRTNADFDPPAKFHISYDAEYMRYLVSFVVQFQLQKGACEKAGIYTSGGKTLLSDCDIYQNVDAGKAIKYHLIRNSWSKQGFNESIFLLEKCCN